MVSYYFPCAGIDPADLPSSIEAKGAVLHRRQWQTSTFDFATLGAKHKIEFSWHLLEVFLSNVHCELEIKGCADFVEAQAKARRLQAMLYVYKLSPYMMPIGVSRPIRDYSGINGRDSPVGLSQLPPELQTGFRSSDGQIEAHIHEPSFQVLMIPSRNRLTKETFQHAAEAAASWESLEERHAVLATARRALQTSPLIPDLGSSLLHAWQGIEALFPQVSSEVTFRLSLLIAQLTRVRANPRETYHSVRSSYKRRSLAAHGGFDKIVYDDWVNAWDLLGLCLLACLERNGLPGEEELTSELLVSIPHGGS